MSAGRVIAVVGPSGVGKDSVMTGLADADPAFEIVRRVITRPADAGGEEFDSVTEDEFLRMARAGMFCIHWRAHGLLYGIRSAVADRAAAGQPFLVNLSRGVLADAASVFANFTVLYLTARPETLAARLQTRGREDLAQIRARLDRAAQPLPKGLHVVHVSNDGPLEDTIAAARAALEPERIP